MPEQPTKRETAVSHFAEEFRRRELLSDAISAVQSHSHRLRHISERQALTRLLTSISDSMFEDFRRAFQKAVEANDG